MKYLLQLLPLLLLSACNGDKGPTAAQRRAEQVETWRRQLLTEQKTQHVTDSLLQAIVPKINQATTSGGFEYEKTEYDDLGRFRPKGMDPGDNVQRTYLRCSVDDYGRTQLIATWCGAKTFVVNQLCIKSSDGSSITTRSVDPNDGSNYSYDIDGTHYQTVTFTFAGRITEGMTQDSTTIANADTDNGALAFIAQHYDDAKLDATLIAISGKEQHVNISNKERQAMAATYELGLLLRESIRLQQENKTAGLKVQYLTEKLSKEEVSSQH